MHDLEVIADPAIAAVALVPVRSRLLSELIEPASAAALAARLSIARQKLNYHLHALESRRLVRVAEERRWGGLTERLLVASAAQYIVSPSALGPAAADPRRATSRASASYPIALAARIVREVGDLLQGASTTGDERPAVAFDTEIRFRSGADRTAFGEEMTRLVTDLVARYHDASAPRGRAHRIVVVAHPLPQSGPSPAE